jgi:hypothetical protein
LILPEKTVGSDCRFFFHLPGSTLLNLGSGIYVPNQHYSWKVEKFFFWARPQNAGRCWKMLEGDQAGSTHKSADVISHNFFNNPKGKMIGKLRCWKKMSPKK